MCHKFIGFFGCSVKAYWMVNIIRSWERKRFICSINRRAWSVYKMFYIILSRCFKNIDIANEVTVNICIGINKGVPYTSLCGKITYSIKPLLRKELVNSIPILKIKFYKSVERIFFTLLKLSILNFIFTFIKIDIYIFTSP